MTTIGCIYSFDDRLSVRCLNAYCLPPQGIAYAKTVAEAMNLKLDMDTPADREKLRRAVLDLVAGRKMRKQKGHA
jgi:hypothetical protein